MSIENFKGLLRPDFFQEKAKKEIVLKPLFLEQKVNNSDSLNLTNYRQLPISGKLKLMSPNLFLQQRGINNVISESGATAGTLNALAQIPGKHWAGTLAGNGGRETAIIVPQNFDRTKPTEVIFYFHGHNGRIDKGLIDKSRGFKDQINNLSEKKNIIVVIPQGPPKETNNRWMNGKYGENMAEFQQDAFNKIKEKLAPGFQIDKVTFKVHSGGGLPISTAASEGKLRADRIDFFDASYGSWASNTHRQMTKKNPDLALNIFYIPGTATQKDALNLANRQGVNLITSSVAHGAFPKKFFEYD